MTITEIAAKAGVSIGTVDRVIHKRGRVAPETEKKIQEIISKYGFQPNPIARHLKLNKKYKIGVLIPLLDSEDGYWAQCYEGTKKAEMELSTFSLELVVIQFDRTIPNACLNAGKQLIEQGVNALVLPPVVPEECEELLHEIKIPYAFFDSPLPEIKSELTVAQNPYRGGLVAGRIMKMLAPQSKEFASLLLYSAAYNSRERSRGFISYFEKDKNVEVFELLYVGTKSYPDLCIYLDAFFKKNPNVEGIFVVNDAVHYAGRYLVEHGLKNKVALIGYDMIDNNKYGLLQGSIDCLIAQRPEFQGYTVIHELFCRKILQQETMPVDIPIDIFFKENIKEIEIG